MTDSTFRELVERICEGHSIEWNGSNAVGRLTDDAKNAMDELSQYLNEIDGELTVWEAEDYLQGVTVEPGTDINKLAQDIMDELEVNTIIDGGLNAVVICLQDKIAD
jgi:hypothetical protein